MSLTCTAVMYHYVRDTERSAFPAIKALGISDFERQLDWLYLHTDIVDFPSFLAWRKGEEKNVEKPLSLLTFDDGICDHYSTVFPILLRRALSGVFFLCGATFDPVPSLLSVHAIHMLLARLGEENFAGAVRDACARKGYALKAASPMPQGVYRYDDAATAAIKRSLNYELPYSLLDTVLDELFRAHIGDPADYARALYLSRSMVSEMAAAGMTFGCHTRCHRVLARLSEDELKSELQGGVALVRSLTGQESVPFSYPYGQPSTYNAATLALLRTEGYSCAFSTVRGALSRESHPLELPRMDTKDLHPFTSPKIPAHA